MNKEAKNGAETRHFEWLQRSWDYDAEDAFSTDGLRLIGELRRHLSDDVIADLTYPQLQFAVGEEPRKLHDECGTSLGSLPAWLAEAAMAWWCLRRRAHAGESEASYFRLFIRSQTGSSIAATDIESIFSGCSP